MSDQPWYKRAWVWTTAACASFLAAAATLVTLRWARQKTPANTARNLADADIKRAEKRADSARTESEAIARKRAALRALESERRARELARGAVSDPNQLLKRHTGGKGEDN